MDQWPWFYGLAMRVGHNINWFFTRYRTATLGHCRTPMDDLGPLKMGLCKCLILLPFPFNGPMAHVFFRRDVYLTVAVKKTLRPEGKKAAGERNGP